MTYQRAPHSRGLQLAALLASLWLSMASAHAQYVWVDEKGLKQYSDRAPPASVPLKRILKAPGLAQLQKQAEAAAADGEAKPESKPDPKGESKPGDAAPKSTKPPTLAEREADYIKRKQETADKDKKAAEEAQRKADQASNCEESRRRKAQLSSGERIGTMDKNGEHGFMSDAERADGIAKAQRALASCQ